MPLLVSHSQERKADKSALANLHEHVTGVCFIDEIEEIMTVIVGTSRCHPYANEHGIDHEVL